MKIDLNQEYKKLCYIQEIKPGRLRIIRIIFGLLLTVITLGIPIFIYWKWQRFKNIIHNLVFEEVGQDSQPIDYYLIVDSKKIQQKSRNITYRNKIISPYLRKTQKILNSYVNESSQQFQLCKYLEHKNLRYVIKDNVLHSLNFKITKPLSEYLKNGLSTKEINQSISIFGKSENFTLSFHHILSKILQQKKLHLIFMLFAVKKIAIGLLESLQQQNQSSISFGILLQIFLTFVILFVISIRGSIEHNRIHYKPQNDIKYQVLRNGQISEVKLNDLLVGDIVIPKIGDIIYFQGLICGQLDSDKYMPYAIVNQKLFNSQDRTIKKIPLLYHLSQVSQTNIINPGSLILNMGLKSELVSLKQLKMSSKIRNSIRTSSKNQSKNSNIYSGIKIQPDYQFFIVVSDNNFLQKFYQSYRDTQYFDNFQSIRKTYDFQQIIFQAAYFSISLITVFFLSKSQKDKQHWIDVLLSLIVLCFPFNLAFFLSFSNFISIQRLRQKQVLVVNPSMEKIGIADKITLQLSAFEQIQFSGYLKKQRCSQMSAPQNFEDSKRLFQIFRKAKQESIFTFLGWIGMMNHPYFHTNPIFKEIFQKYDFILKEKSEYDDDQESHLRVQNKQTMAVKIDWKQIQRFPISDKFIESVIIQDLSTNRFQNKFFAILQGDYTSQECEDYFDDIVEEYGKQQYKEVMKRLFLNGNKVKYICLKKITNVNDNRSKIQKLERKNIQKKVSFGGFLVFDQWPSEESMRTLLQFENNQFDRVDSGIKVTIFSVRQQNALAGYNHILVNSSILFDQSSFDRASQLFLTKSQYNGVTHVGNGILDRGSLLISDISINKVSESYIPADFHISKSQSILDLLYEGAWSLYNSTLTIVCLVMFNFSKIIGQLMLFQNKKINKIVAQPLSGSLNRIFLIDFGALIVPILLLNLYEPTNRLVRKHQRTFFRINLMFHLFISIIGMIVLYAIEFLDHGFQGACSTFQINSSESHFIAARFFQQHDQSQKMNSCQGIIDFVNISFGLIVIFLVDRQSQERKARNLIVGMINKIYIIFLWVGSIFFFHIPSKIAIRSLIIIVVLTVGMYLFDYVRGQKINHQENKILNDEKVYQSQRRTQNQSKIRTQEN